VNDEEELRESLISIEEDVEDVLETGITHPYAKSKNIGERLWGLEGNYRTRGILKFLLEADADAFFDDLAREALTYLTLLKAHGAKLNVPAAYVKGSIYYPLACAIAGGNMELAAEIDALLPSKMGKSDDEELFAFTTVLRRLVTGNKKDIAAAREQLAKAAPDSKRYGAVVDLARSIEAEDEKGFNEALAVYLAAIGKPSRDELEEMDPGEDQVSIEALAFIQLAKHRKLKIRAKHRLVPPPLQEARAVVPEDGYPTWPG
jgi:hypothetical protein